MSEMHWIKIAMRPRVKGWFGIEQEFAAMLEEVYTDVYEGATFCQANEEILVEHTTFDDIRRHGVKEIAQTRGGDSFRYRWLSFWVQRQEYEIAIKLHDEASHSIEIGLQSGPIFRFESARVFEFKWMQDVLFELIDAMRERGRPAESVQIEIQL